MTVHAPHKTVWPVSVRRYVLISIAIGIATGFVIVIASLAQSSRSVVAIGQPSMSTSTAIKVTAVIEVAARELMSGQEIAGEKGLIVRLEVTNKTSAAQQFIPVSQVYIKSADGRLYQMKPVHGTVRPIAAGTIAARETITGDISFMVDRTAPGLQLHLDTRWDATPPLVVQL